MFAARHNQPSVVEWLLQQQPTTINLSSNENQTALHIAVMHEHWVVAVVLVAGGSDHVVDQ